MPLSCYAFTHPAGRLKNEDYSSHLIENTWSCFIVADGLGGHTKGEIASQFFCEAVLEKAPDYAEAIKASPESGIVSFLEAAHQQMRHQISDKFGLIDTHTTFVLAWLTADFMVTAHVGDSRIYWLSPKEILWRSADHTLVQTLFEEGALTEEEMLSHPLQNRLLRSVSVLSLSEPEIVKHPPLAPEQRLLLCTDGFWTQILPTDLVPMIYSDDLAEQLPVWITQILSEDVTADNVTLQVIQHKAG